MYIPILFELVVIIINYYIKFTGNKKIVLYIHIHHIYRLEGEK